MAANSRIENINLIRRLPASNLSGGPQFQHVRLGILPRAFKLTLAQLVTSDSLLIEVAQLITEDPVYRREFGPGAIMGGHDGRTTPPKDIDLTLPADGAYNMVPVVKLVGQYRNLLF